MQQIPYPKAHPTILRLPRPETQPGHSEQEQQSLQQKHVSQQPSLETFSVLHAHSWLNRDLCGMECPLDGGSVTEKAALRGHRGIPTIPVHFHWMLGLGRRRWMSFLEGRILLASRGGRARLRCL